MKRGRSLVAEYFLALAIVGVCCLPFLPTWQWRLLGGVWVGAVLVLALLTWIASREEP